METKQRQIYNWMGYPDNYKKGVTNKEIKKRFGENYNNAWMKLKRKTKAVFYENGRWFRWDNQ